MPFIRFYRSESVLYLAAIVFGFDWHGFSWFNAVRLNLFPFMRLVPASLTLFFILIQLIPATGSGQKKSKEVFRPFPQHVVYVKGSIMPNKLTREQLDSETSHFYVEWKQEYLRGVKGTDQAYIWFGDATENTLCVSEGQGYGMVIVALMAGADPVARQSFDSLYRYVLAHPSKPDRPLMSWAQEAGNKDRDNTSATDGDLDIGYALLLAHSQWGSRGSINYLDSAKKMIGAILKHDINSNLNNILLSDAVEAGSPDFYDTRSSDFMPSHLKSFEEATGNKRWDKVVDREYTLFEQMQDKFSPDAGLIPDFITDIDGTPAPAPPKYLESRYDGAYNFNACRVPWRIATDYLLTGDQRSLVMVQKINKWIRETSSDNPDNISAGYSLQGDDIKSREYEALCFIAPFAVSAMVSPENQNWLNRIWDYMVHFKRSEFGYYDNSIKMMAMIIISGNYWMPSTPGR